MSFFRNANCDRCNPIPIPMADDPAIAAKNFHFFLSDLNLIDER